MSRSAIAVMKFRPTKLLATLSAFAARSNRTNAAKMSLAFQPTSDLAKALTARTKRVPVVFNGIGCASMSFLRQIRRFCWAADRVYSPNWTAASARATRDGWRRASAVVNMSCGRHNLASAALTIGEAAYTQGGFDGQGIVGKGSRADRRLLARG